MEIQKNLQVKMVNGISHASMEKMNAHGIFLKLVLITGMIKTDKKTSHLHSTSLHALKHKKSSLRITLLMKLPPNVRKKLVIQNLKNC